MNKPVLHFLFLALAAFAAFPAAAQDIWQNEDEQEEEQKPQEPYRAYEEMPDTSETGDYLSAAYYHALVRQAIQQRPRKFEFGMLRSLYPRIDEYDPIGEATRQKMVSLAFTIESDPDQKKRKEAFDEYGALVSAHLANIDVVSQALVLSQGDRLYGDPAFYEWMRAGLLRDIVYSGSGKSLVGAYDVMTLGEEAFLMNALRLKVLKTEPRESGGVYYNMHLVKDPKYNEPYWTFVDVSQPLRFLKRQQERQEKVFIIPAQ